MEAMNSKHRAYPPEQEPKVIAIAATQTTSSPALFWACILSVLAYMGFHLLFTGF
jgi:hypothetical protein